MEHPTLNHGVGTGPPHKNPPSNNLWIGNVSPDVTEADLKSIFEIHGQIDTVSAYSTRNYAFVCFKHIDDAKSAREKLQGHLLRGNSLKVEFAKPAKPSKSLWVSGISLSISKEELEKEFLRYGTIQEFRFLRDRSTAYVDYVELEDATQALNNVNGKQIGGSQLRVAFMRSNSSRRELGLDAKEGQFPSRNNVPTDFYWMGQESSNNYPESSLSVSKGKNFLPVGPRFDDGMPSKVLWIRHPPNLILEEDILHNAMILFGEIERIKTFSDRNYAFVEFRSVEEARRAKDGLQGKLFNDPRISIDYFSDEPLFQPVHMDIIGFNRPVSLGNNPRRLPGLASSPSADYNAPNKSAYRAWDAFDANQPQREFKRPRFDASLPPERTENQGELYRRHPRQNGDCIWRGLIAKGGTPVCHARCVPVGEGLGADIPNVINCSARTGLDMLSKHYDDATGFGIVSILPDSEEDFVSYTEFLKYLASKDRAGVAKFYDGTTLFLVPPSDFLRKVLRVVGPPRLYGVVLKFPQAVPSNPSLNPFSMPPQYDDGLKMPTLQRGYGDITPDQRVPRLDNSRALPEDFKFPPTTTVASQAGLALTPELIATLTSLLPANSVSSGPQTSYSQIHDQKNNFSSQGATLLRPMAPVFPLQSGSEINQLYRQGSQPYVVQPSGVEPTRKSQPLATDPNGVTQENGETEAEKNERYKTTLLLAANLLSKIHHPSGNEPEQGAGSQ